MFSKQDVVKPRTAEDLERRYNFGKTFAETSGLIAENSKTIDESNKAIAQIKRTVTDQDAAIASLTTWKGETSESLASITQRVSDAESSIEMLTEMQDGDVSSIASIEQRVTNAEATIELLTELNTGDQSSLAALVTKVNANEASIESLTEWKDDTTESIASIEQTASDQGASIKSLTEWKGDVEGDVESIASIEQKANANEASITSLATWKGGVEDDVSSIASIKQKADANEAKIETLTEWKDETTKSVASITQTVSDQGAEIALKASKTEVTEQLGDYYTKEETNAELVVRDDAIKTSVSKTYATKDELSGVEKRVTGAETLIEQNADEIALRATKTEVTTAKDEAIQSANDSTDGKLKSYSTTAQMNAAIEISAGKITSEVESTYVTKDDLTGEIKDVTDTISEIKQTADESHAGIELLVEYDSNGKPTASGSMVIKAINGESSAKINADRVDIEGKELNIKVQSTNVLGTLSADKIHSGTIRSNANKQASTDTIYVWTDGLLTEKLFIGTATENLEISSDGKVLEELDFHGDILVLPEGIEEIATQCVGVFSTLVLPESLKPMGSGTFANCEYLSNVVIKGSLAMAEDAFKNCPRLENVFVVLPDLAETVMPECLSHCKVYCYSEGRPVTTGDFWRYEQIGLSIDLNTGTILSPTMQLGDKLHFKGNNHEMTIEDDGLQIEHMDVATPETIKIAHDSIVSEWGSQKRFSASQAGFTTGLPYSYDYSNMPTSFHGVQNTNGGDLVGMRIGTTTELIAGSFHTVPKLEILVGGKVYMTFCNNKITVADGITVEGI